MADKYQEIEPNCGIKVTNVRVFPFKETSTRIYEDLHKGYGNDYA